MSSASLLFAPLKRMRQRLLESERAQNCQHQLCHTAIPSCLSTDLPAGPSLFQSNSVQPYMKYYFIPTRRAGIKKSDDNKCWQGCGDAGTFIHCWWECKMVQTLWKTVWGFLRRINIRVTPQPRNSTPRCVPKRTENMCPHKKLHMDVHSSNSHNSQKVETVPQPMSG